jgi:hypothetical protein
MKRLLFSLIFVSTQFFFTACNQKTEDPALAAKSFIEAFLEKDFKKAGEFATKDSKTLLDLIKSMAEMGGDLNYSTFGLTDQILENAVFETESINGENAVVKVIIENKTPQSINLIREDGKWKVALDKESFREILPESSQNTDDKPDEANDSEPSEIKQGNEDTTMGNGKPKIQPANDSLPKE